MNHWQGYPVPAMRFEALQGDRPLRCFVDRPINLFAMFEASVTRAPDAETIVCDDRRRSSSARIEPFRATVPVLLVPAPA